VEVREVKPGKREELIRPGDGMGEVFLEEEGEQGE